MKKLYTILFLLVISAITWAQTPEKISYQAVVRDANNNLVRNTKIGMQISILQGSTNGMAVYVETQTPTSNNNGLVSVEIGSGTVITGDFSTIDWANNIYYIKTEIDLNGGTNYNITGISQILSVPYALHAKSAESISGTIPETDPVYSSWNKSYYDLINKPDIIDSIITVIDTTTQFVRTELDGDTTNEIQDLNLDTTTNILKITKNNDATNIDLSKYLDNTDTHITDAEISAMGYIKTDNVGNKTFSVSHATNVTNSYVYMDTVNVKANELVHIVGFKKSSGSDFTVYIRDINGNGVTVEGYIVNELGDMIMITQQPDGGILPFDTHNNSISAYFMPDTDMTLVILAKELTANTNGTGEAFIIVSQ